MYAADRKVQGLSALASGVVVFCLGAALILGLGVSRLASSAQNLAAVVFPTEPPPPPPPPPEIERPRPKVEKAAAIGDPAPRALKNRATQIVAPPVKVILKPLPVVTAPVANLGDAASNGASEFRGPGQGAGGVGDGFGGGGQGGTGNGRGGGGGGGPAVQDPRAIRDKLRTADIPEDVWPSERGRLSIEVLYLIRADGRVSDCRAIDSSGDLRADAYVCRLIEQRFLFRPALNRFGQPVAIKSVQHHEFHYR